MSKGTNHVDFAWGPDLEVLRCAVCHVVFRIVSPGEKTLTSFEVQKAITDCLGPQPAPLFLDVALSSETATAHVGFPPGGASAIDLLRSTLDGRQVTLSSGKKVKMRVRRVATEGAAAARPWKEYFFQADAEASSAVQEELFRRAPPGLRPDTLVLRELPCKWLKVSEIEEGAWGEEEQQAEQTASLRAQVELALATVPSKIEAVFLPDGLHVDVYIQFARTLAELEKAFSRWYGKALRFLPTKAVRPLKVEVDHSGYFSQAQTSLRQNARDRELQARQGLEVARCQLEEELTAVQVKFQALSAEAKAATGRHVDARATPHLQAALTRLGQALAEGQSKCQVASTAGDKEIIAGLLAEVAALQRVCHEKAKAAQSALLDVEDEAREKQRLHEVRELRVVNAKALKELDGQWRAGLDGLESKKARRQAKLCQVFVDTAEDALAQARNNVLREAARIVNLEEYEELLASSLRKAQGHVDCALGLLRLEAEAQVLEDGLHKVTQAMKKAGEDVAHAHSPDSDGTWPRFLQCPAWAGALRKARTAMLLVNEKRQSENGNVDQASVDDFAKSVGELREHYEYALRPAWDLYVRFLSCQCRLQGAWEEWHAKQAQQEVPTALMDLLATAKGTLDGTFTGLLATEREENKETALARLEESVAAVESMADGEKEKLRLRQEARLRLIEEKALAKRTREGVAKAKAREEATTQLKLERLDRRRAHLHESLRVEQAWEALRAARAAGRIPAEPLLDADEDSGSQDEGEDGLSGRGAVVVPPAPTQDRDRWPMARADAEPPLNLAWHDALPNQISKDFWVGCRQQKAEEEARIVKHKTAVRYRLRGEAVDPTARPHKRKKRRSAEGQQSRARSVVEVVVSPFDGQVM